MKNLILILLFLFSGLHFVNAQDLQFSISAKANHSFANVAHNTDLQDFERSSSFINAGSIVGQTGFEISATVQMKLDEKIKIISGLAFQQIRFERQENSLFGAFVVTDNNGEIINLPSDVFFIDPTSPNFSLESSRVKNNIQISYIKIPFLAEIDIIKEKVFFQLGFYGASKVSVKGDNFISSPRFVDPFSSIVEALPPPGEQFTSLLVGFQSGIRVELIKHLSVQIDYSRSMNSLFNEDNFAKANMNNISAGLSWSFDI